MDKAQTKECFKPHTMLHSLFGLGLGIIAAAIFNFHGMAGFSLGLVLIVIAFVGDFMMGKKTQKK